MTSRDIAADTSRQLDKTHAKLLSRFSTRKKVENQHEMDGRNSEDRGNPHTSAEAHDIQCNLSNIPQSQQPATGRPSCSDNISESKSESDRSKQQYNPGQPCAEHASEEEASTTYRINTLRRDSDEPDSEDQDEESSNIKPDDLLNIVFNFDMPREVNLNVKIKGDFNVTVLA